MLGFPEGAEDGERASWLERSENGAADGIPAAVANMALAPDETRLRFRIAEEASKRVTDSPLLQVFVIQALLGADSVRRSGDAVKMTGEMIAECNEAYGELASSSWFFTHLRLMQGLLGSDDSPPEFSEEAPYTCHRKIVPWLISVLVGGKLGVRVGSGSPPRTSHGGGSASSRTTPMSPGPTSPSRPGRADSDDVRDADGVPRLPSPAGGTGAVGGAVAGAPEESDPEVDVLDESQLAVDRERNSVALLGDSLITRDRSEMYRSPTASLAPTNRAWWAEVHQRAVETLRKNPALADGDVVAAATSDHIRLRTAFQGGRGRRRGTELSEAQREQAEPKALEVVELHREALGVDPETGLAELEGGWRGRIATGDEMWERLWFELDDEERVVRVAGADLLDVLPPDYVIVPPEYRPPRDPFVLYGASEYGVSAPSEGTPGLALVPAETRDAVIASDPSLLKRKGDVAIRELVMQRGRGPKVAELTNLLRRDAELARLIPETTYAPGLDRTENLEFAFPTDLEEMAPVQVSGPAGLFARRRIRELEAKANGILQGMGVRDYRAVANASQMSFTRWGEPNWWPIAIQHDPYFDPDDPAVLSEPYGPRGEVRTLDDDSEILVLDGEVTRLLRDNAQREAVLQETHKLVEGLARNPFESDFALAVPSTDRGRYTDRSIEYRIPENGGGAAVSLQELAEKNPPLHAAVEKHLARVGKWMRSDLHFGDDGTKYADNGLTVHFGFDPTRVLVSENEGQIQIVWLDPIRVGAVPPIETNGPNGDDGDDSGASEDASGVSEAGSENGDAETPAAEPPPAPRSERVPEVPRGEIPMEVLRADIAKLNEILAKRGEKQVSLAQLAELQRQMGRLGTRDRQQTDIFWFAPNGVVRRMLSSPVANYLGPDAFELEDFEDKELVILGWAPGRGGYYSLVPEDPWHWSLFFPVSPEAAREWRETVEHDRQLSAVTVQSQPPNIFQRMGSRLASWWRRRRSTPTRQVLHRARTYPIRTPDGSEQPVQQTLDGRYWNPSIESPRRNLRHRSSSRASRSSARGRLQPRRYRSHRRLGPPVQSNPPPSDLLGPSRTWFANQYVASAVVKWMRWLKEDPKLGPLVSAPVMAEVPMTDAAGNEVPGAYTRDVVLWTTDLDVERVSDSAPRPVEVWWDRSAGLMEYQTPAVRFSDLPTHLQDKARRLMTDAYRHARDLIRRRGAAVETDDGRVVSMTVNERRESFEFRVRRDSQGRIASLEGIARWRNPLRARIARQTRQTEFSALSGARRGKGA